GVTAAVPMITKGGLETVTRHLAMEYARDGIRVNGVAPGVVYTPLHRDTPKEVMESLSPMGRPSTVKDIVDAIMYLTDAATVTGQTLYVDGGEHFGRWKPKRALGMSSSQGGGGGLHHAFPSGLPDTNSGRPGILVALHRR